MVILDEWWRLKMKHYEAGKGSSSRPRQVSNEDYANRWDAIFQRDMQEEEPVGKPLKDEPLKEDEND
jgi:hypothetical protein